MGEKGETLILNERKNFGIELEFNRKKSSFYFLKFEKIDVLPL